MRASAYGLIRSGTRVSAIDLTKVGTHASECIRSYQENVVLDVVGVLQVQGERARAIVVRDSRELELVGEQVDGL